MTSKGISERRNRDKPFQAITDLYVAGSLSLTRKALGDQYTTTLRILYRMYVDYISSTRTLGLTTPQLLQQLGLRRTRTNYRRLRPMLNTLLNLNLIKKNPQGSITSMNSTLSMTSPWSSLRACFGVLRY